MFWPGQSPDLNPIENIWSHIKHKLTRKHFSTTHQLFECCGPASCHVPSLAFLTLRHKATCTSADCSNQCRSGSAAPPSSVSTKPFRDQTSSLSFTIVGDFLSRKTSPLHYTADHLRSLPQLPPAPEIPQDSSSTVPLGFRSMVSLPSTRPRGLGSHGKACTRHGQSRLAAFSRPTTPRR